MQLQKYKYQIQLFINLIIFTICSSISLYIYFEVKNIGYRYLYLMPLIYLVTHLFVYSKIIFKKFRIFMFVFISMIVVRYVFLPFLIVYSGHYGGRSRIPPNANSYQNAIFLMCYELIIVSIYIYFMEKKGEKKNKINLISSNKNNYFYLIVFIIFTFFIFVNRSLLSCISFFTPTYKEVTDNMSIFQLLVLNGFVISKQIVSISIISYFYCKYRVHKKKIWIILSVLIILVDISIYYGTNRSKILIPTIIYIYIICQLYGKKIKKYILLICLTLFLLLSGVSSYREGVSFTKNKNQLIDKTDTLQVYTGGIYNVAIAVETKKYFPDSTKLSVLFFDVFRPMLGINILIKTLPFKYSNIYFNKRMWFKIDRRSQIIPMIGQGNLFFGFLLSPLFSLIFLKLSYIIQNIVDNTNKLEIYYFFNLILARIGFMMGQNTMNIINYISFNIILFLSFYYINKWNKKYFLI